MSLGRVLVGLGLLLVSAPGRAAVGSWQPLLNVPTAPLYNGNATGYGEMLLLTDGTVMVKVQSNLTTRATNLWARLTPDANGSYVNGTWSPLAPMNYPRLFFSSAVMKDGRVFVAGGEYPRDPVDASLSGPQSSKVEIYDPVTNVWTLVGGWSYGDIADSTAKVLPDGRILLLECVPFQSEGGWIYDPDPNSLQPWKSIASKIGGDFNDEESVVALPEGTFLSVDNGVSNLMTPPPKHAQKYLPSSNTWIDAGMTNIDLVNPGSVAPLGREIGPGLLLYDGRALFIGSLITTGVAGKTALYTPGANPTLAGSWAAGPTLTNGATTLYSDDEPGAVMPNGHVLFVADSEQNTNFMLEYDPVANSLATAPYPGLLIGSSHYNMLVLPNGEVLLSTKTQSLYVYTPAGAPNAAWKPTISSITGSGPYVVSGTQLNGLTEGAYEGDDVQMATNYPIVRLVDGAGKVFYARTYGFSTMGVATGNTPVSATFSTAGIPNGSYSVYAVANGIASDPAALTIGGDAGASSDAGFIADAGADAAVAPDAAVDAAETQDAANDSVDALASAPLDAGADGGAVDGGAVDGSPMPARPGQGCGCVVGARPVRTPGALPVALGLLGALVLYRRRRVVE